MEVRKRNQQIAFLQVPLLCQKFSPCIGDMRCEPTTKARKTITSPREIDSNSAIALRILDFHAVKVSSLGKNTVVGIPTALPFLVFV